MEENTKQQLGSGGFCICPECKTKVEHPEGIPCKDLLCPKCGTPMMREKTKNQEE